jgi:hypothetical protein
MGERVALYLSFAMHIAADLSKHDFGPVNSVESLYVGRGPPVEGDLPEVPGRARESMARRGISVRHRVLAVAEVEPASVEFHFVRSLEDEPWSIGEVQVPAALAPAGWDGSNSVFAAMSAEHAITIKRAETAFGAALASPEEAEWLEVPVGSALLEVRGFNTDQQGRVVGSFAHRIRGDRAEYVVRLPR